MLGKSRQAVLPSTYWHSCRSLLKSCQGYLWWESKSKTVRWNREFPVLIPEEHNKEASHAKIHTSPAVVMCVCRLTNKCVVPRGQTAGMFPIHLQGVSFGSILVWPGAMRLIRSVCMCVFPVMWLTGSPIYITTTSTKWDQPAGREWWILILSSIWTVVGS